MKACENEIEAASHHLINEIGYNIGENQ